MQNLELTVNRSISTMAAVPATLLLVVMSGLAFSFEGHISCIGLGKGIAVAVRIRGFVVEAAQTHGAPHHTFGSLEQNKETSIKHQGQSTKQ